MYEIEEINGEKFVTLPVIETESDYSWQLSALKSRIDHPEWYEKTEDVEMVKERIRTWLRQHKSEYPEYIREKRQRQNILEVLEIKPGYPTALDMVMGRGEE